MKKFSKIVLIASAVLMLAGAAYAMPITGEMGMTGFGLPAIDTSGVNKIPAPLMTVVDVATGDFATYLNPTDEIEFSGFTFEFPGTPPTPVADPLWKGGGFSFVLDSINYSRGDGQIEFDGVGRLSGNGFDETIGAWTMLLDEHSNSFHFDSSTTAAPAPTPEPATILLLGLGLTGIAGFGRKKLKK